MSKSEKTAFWVAPFVATICWYLYMLAWVGFHNGYIRLRTDILAFFIGAITLGFPIALAATILFGLPAYFILKRLNAIKLSTTYGAGAMIGMLTALCFAWLTKDTTMLPVPVGVVIGWAGAASWWWSALPTTGK
jgi:hypothetical protein